MSLPTKTPQIIPFDKGKSKFLRSASEITNIRKFQADTAYYYDNSETQAKDLASIYGPTMYPQTLKQGGLALDAASLLSPQPEKPISLSSDGSILNSDVLTPDAPGYDIMVMAGQSNGVGTNNYSVITPTTSAPTLIDANTVRYPYTGFTNNFSLGTKALVTGYTVSGSGFNGTGLVTAIDTGASTVTIAIPSNGSATNSSSTARIRILDFDDQLFLTAIPPTFSGTSTTYTYGFYAGTLPAVNATVTVQNLTVPTTSFGFNGTGKVSAIDDSTKTITVDIESSAGGITGATYNSGTGATVYTCTNEFVAGTTVVSIIGVQVSAGVASLFNISGTVSARTSTTFTITQSTSLTSATYSSGGGVVPIPLTTANNPPRIVVISPFDLSSKVFTLLGTNNAVLKAFDPLPQNNLDLFNGTGTPNGRSSLVTLAYNYANSSNLRTGRRVLLVQTSMSSQSFTAPDINGTGRWQSTSPFVGGSTYTNCINRIQASMTQTFGTSVPADNRVVAVFWQEGESDIGQSTAPEYKANLLNFVKNLRSFIASVSTNTLGLTSGESAVMANTFSFLVGAMTKGFDGTSGNAAQLAITNAAKDVGLTTIGGEAVPRSAYVDNTGIPTTDIHYSGTDLKILGEKYFSSFNTVVTSYSGISTVTSAYLSRYSLRKVSPTLTINWNLSTPSDVTVDVYVAAIPSSKYGVLVNSGVILANTTKVVSAFKPIDNVYFYAVITPKSATSNGIPFTTSAVLNIPTGSTPATIVSPSIAIQSQKLVATWSAPLACSALVEFFSNSANSNTGGTIVSRITVMPGTTTATIPNSLVSRSFYYAVITPAGGTPVTSGTVQQPITPILQTTFSAALSVVGKIDPVSDSTINGSITGSVITVSSGGVAKIGHILSGITTTNGGRPVYIMSTRVTPPATGSYSAILSESISSRTLGSITLTGCGLLTVTSGTPVAGAVITSGASEGTRIVGPTPDPNVWVVSISQTVAAGTTFQFSGPVDTSTSNKQFKLVNAEHVSNPISFPPDPIMNSVVYNSDSITVAGTSPFIGVLGGFPGGSFTKMLWVNLTNLSVSSPNLIGTNNCPLFFSVQVLKSVVSSVSLNDGPSVSNLNPVNGIWTHVAAVYDASTNQGSVYVNGIKDSSTVYTYKEITTLSGIKPYLGTNNVRYSYANLSIGGFDGSNGLFKGRMDDIRIYPLALTDAEVLSVVNEKMLITNLVTTSPGLVPNTTISLSWTAPTGVTVSSYVLKQSIDEGVSWTIPGSYGIVIGLGTATIDGLTTGTRYAFSVAAVSGGKTGLSAIINTSTFGNPVFRLVGVGSNPVVDIVSGRQLTLGSAGTTLDANTATAISGITRKVMTIPNTGYITIGGDMPAGSHSFCCWMKATACTTLFQYSTVRGAGGVGGDSDIQHLIWTGNSPGAFGLSTAIFGISPQVHTHSAKTLRVIAGGVIECDGDHTLTNNQEIRFEKSYFGPNATITPATFITSDTSYFVNVVSTTQFSLKVSSGGAAVSPVPPVGSFVTGVFIPNSAHTSNTTWVHVASVYDQINGTSSIYLTTTFAGVAPKTLVPRLFRVSGDRVVFPGVTRGSVAADLFQIGKYSNTAPNFNGLVDDFRAYAKVLSPQEIAAIAAGDA